jgi:hypothetical protein
MPGELNMTTGITIEEAGNILFQIENRYMLPELVDERGLVARLTLEQAGKFAVRKVCGGSLESLDAKYWASDKEVSNARKLVIDYLKGGWMPVRIFQKFGLGTHIHYLTKDQYGLLPQLNEGARHRLFEYIGRLVLQELRDLHPNVYVALNKLNPNTLFLQS